MEQQDRVRLWIIAMRSRGLQLRVDQGKILAGPPDKVLPQDREHITSARELFLRILTLGDCPVCGRLLHAEGACWHCHDRKCANCRRWTGSAFIVHCDMCAKAMADAETESAPGGASPVGRDAPGGAWAGE